MLEFIRMGREIKHLISILQLMRNVITYLVMKKIKNE